MGATSDLRGAGALVPHHHPEQVTAAKPAIGTQSPTQLSRSLVALIAVATGAVVANLYYAQPVLHRWRTTSTPVRASPR